MLSRDDSRRLGLPRSAIVILLLLAAGGALLSPYAGAREAGQYRTLERLRMAEAADAHFTKATDHLAARREPRRDRVRTVRSARSRETRHGVP